VELLRGAAASTLGEFRTSGIDAEIRGGAGAGIPLARTSGLAEPPGSLFDEATWRRLSRSGTPAILPVGADRRCAVRFVAIGSGAPPVALSLAHRTLGVDNALASIRRSLIEIGLAGLGLALLGGYWLATRALRPIDALTRQAGLLAEGAEAASAPRLDVLNPDDELGRLASTFNRLLERIDAAVRQLRSFIADAAHELKTPVAIVRAEAELAVSTPRGAEAYRESLLAIAGESERLSELVGDLTLLAEGQTLTHPLERRLVDLNDLLHEVRRSLHPVAAGRNVVIDVEAVGGCVEYRGDERLLRQTFTNLVENAVKFSPRSGRVRIGLIEGAGLHEIRVEDAAPTLSIEERRHVFERFYRAARARREEASGSGLGLAIVQWAVQLHGGRVRVEPREPHGNAFVVELPVLHEAAPHRMA